MSYKLGTRSLQNLSGVHPDLVSVVEKAIKITKVDFTVIEGVRNINRQRQLVKSGASQTMNSRHLTGHAVDIAPWPISWDWEKFYPIIDSFILAAKELDCPVRWGGNWGVKDIRDWDGTAVELNGSYKGKFADGPHLEIPRGFGYE